MKFLLLLILLTSFAYSQTDWQKWEKTEVNYKIPEKGKRVYRLDTSGIGVTIASSFKNVYWFLFSDHDGDNCPFHPTCSQFMMEAVRKTDFFSGLLMFADRFTRDSNFFKSIDHYPLHESGRFFDPIDNYTLDRSKIKYIPPTKIITDEK